METKKNYKLVVIGDGAVGKTCLLMAYAKDFFPKDYVPTVFDNYQKDIDYESGKYFFNLWDTAGQEDYEHIRKLSYPGTDVFMLCYSISSRTSFENVRDKWTSDLKELELDKVPKILIATKLDLRKDLSYNRKYEEENGEKLISTSEGEDLAKFIGAFSFMECSAKEFINIQSVFDTVIKNMVDKKIPPKPKKKSLFSSSSAQEDVEGDVSLFSDE